MDETLSPDNELQRELAYYKKQLDQISGESIQHDFVLSSLQHELKQKKEGFSILTNLQREFSVTTPLHVIFSKAVKAINAQLKMDRSVVLLPVSSPNTFKASHWYGFREEQIPMMETTEVEIPSDFCRSGQYILLNKMITADETSKQIQKIFTVNYFIGVPILLDEKPIAFMISGRQFEKIPFIPPLDKGDADTLMAIAGLISTVCQDKKMMELKLQKAEVEKQREAIAAQRDKLEQTLNELRNTQALLVQKEKMASLGELTAGIAHEIQNPLNFVNNFSEVNTELIDELKGERSKAKGERMCMPKIG